MKIGIIGGSGLENPEILTDFKIKEVETPFGKPSSPITTGKIGEIVECCFIIDIPNLKGKEKLSKYPTFSLINFEGD